LDLDWFTADRDRIEELARRLTAWCATHDMVCAVEQEYPGFRRFRVDGDGETTLVDIVHEPVPQRVPLLNKPRRDGVRIDPVEEIAANKLAALLGRGETKDLVDLFVMSESGLDVLDAFEAAHAKHAGLEPATLAWVLSTVPTETDELLLLRPIEAAALARFRDAFVARLQAMAWPG
jgi:hypothetical protein